MTETEATQRTVTAEMLKERLDEASKGHHGEGCECSTASSSVDEMLAVQQEDGGFVGAGPWTEDEAAEILKWWTSPLEAAREASKFRPEDVDGIVASILSQGVTPAEARTGISDRKAAVLDGLALIKANLPEFARAAAALALVVKVHQVHGNALTAALEGAAAGEMARVESALNKSLDMLTAVVKSMD